MLQWLSCFLKEGYWFRKITFSFTIFSISLPSSQFCFSNCWINDKLHYLLNYFCWINFSEIYLHFFFFSVLYFLVVHLATCYIFHAFTVFCNLLHNPLGKQNNSKWRTNEILATSAQKDCVMSSDLHDISAHLCKAWRMPRTCSNLKTYNSFSFLMLQRVLIFL